MTAIRAWEPIDRPRPTARDRHVIADAGHAAGMLTAIVAQLPQILARIHDATNGQPGATRTDGTCTHGHATVVDEHGHPMPAIADPTGETGIRPDPAAIASKRIEALTRRIHTDTLALAAETDVWTGRAPLPSELRDTEKVNTPGCESCAKIDGHGGQPWWNEVDRTIRLGVLGKAIRVCTWCATQYRKDGRLPTKAELEDHRDGKRRRRPA